MKEKITDSFRKAGAHAVHATAGKVVTINALIKHAWFGHDPRGICQTPWRKIWDGRSHGGSVAEVRKCAVHHRVIDFPEIDKEPGIGDPEVGNPDSVNRRTLPIRRSSRGAGQTVNGGENRSHSF